MPQFLLTQAEYDALAPRAQLDAAIESLKKLAPMVARADPTQRGCIHDHPVRGGNRWGGYCDDCPAADLGCPLTKNWSK